MTDDNDHTWHVYFISSSKAESGPTPAGKKIARKTTVAGGARIDLEEVAREQQIRNRKQMEEILASVKAKQEGQPGDIKTLSTSGRNGDINAINGASTNGSGRGAEDAEDTEDKEVKLLFNDRMHNKHSRSGGADFNKVTGKVDLCLTLHFPHSALQ